MLAKREDNGKDLRCEATNPALEATLIDTATIRVEFPPTQVTVAVRPDKLRTGQTGSLTCESASSNPVSRLMWIHNGVLIPSTTNSTVDGQYGGTISKSSLDLPITADLHGAVITCQATNDIGGQSIHDAITLEVLYKPQFVHPPDYSVDVVEGQAAVVNMTAQSNPAVLTYAWSRDDVVIRSDQLATFNNDRVLANGSLLNLSVVRREDAGDYQCQATNSEGTQSAIVRLNVQYPAAIVQSRSIVMVSEGVDAYLECQATGNPLTKSTVNWHREGFDMEARTEQSFGLGVAYLTVRQVNRIDTGAFECIADNGIGHPTIHKTWLVVKYKPIMDESPQNKKSAGDEGQRAKLVCRAQGAPNITFTWSREGVTLSASDKYDITLTQIDLVVWESTLEVSALRSRDYGQYDCIARNEMGFNKTSVILTGTSRPDPPLTLHVVNASHDAVELSWKPGFDGGLPQAYRIRYRQIGTDFFKYVDAYPPNITVLSIGGLSLATEYLFGIMASNDLGHSNYTSDVVKAKTSSKFLFED